ncbi:MAG: cob(I)yrinic acid a,c-diamide adenosyltransferase [Candidatus Njordarchaeia archaeon]
MGKYGSGDSGKSSTLASGGRIWKDSLIFHAIGDLDELNSFIGLAVSFCEGEKFGEIRDILVGIQSDIFKIGGMINAYGSNFYDKVEKIDEEDLKRIKDGVNFFKVKLEELHHFILPGGSKLASFLHVARAVCRRAERSLVALKKEVDFPDIVLRYINRLSTLLFILARYANKLDGFQDVAWKR